LLDEGYAATFRELMETTDWDRYGRASGNQRCADCMVHCGYEPSAVAATFGSWRGFLRTARLTLFGAKASDGLDESSEPSLPHSRSDRAPTLYTIVLARSESTAASAVERHDGALIDRGVALK
jgi:hypothetical protein